MWATSGDVCVSGNAAHLTTQSKLVPVTSTRVRDPYEPAVWHARMRSAACESGDSFFCLASPFEVRGFDVAGNGLSSHAVDLTPQLTKSTEPLEVDRGAAVSIDVDSTGKAEWRLRSSGRTIGHADFPPGAPLRLVVYLGTFMDTVELLS